MRLVAGRPDGSIEILDGYRAAARNGRALVAVGPDDLLPMPQEATLSRLPGRRPLAVDSDGGAVAVDGDWLAVAAVMPVGLLRTLLPATERTAGARRLPLFGYTAVVEHGGDLMCAALRTDSFEWWQPANFGRADLPAAVQAARDALPGNRLVDHLANCALVNRCYTAQNTFHRRYEGALPASPACNADCLGCISLQTDGEVPAPQARMGFAPTADELVALADWHLQGDDSAIVSFGQGCEGEALTRDDALVDATRRIRERHPHATIHVNTNASKPHILERLIDAGLNSVRISAISFNDAVFRPYYRPVGYGLEDVVACGALMHARGGQVCLNLLTFPGVTDVESEIDATVRACRAMGVDQVQWRSLNVDHDWLLDVLPALPAGVGMRAAHQRIRDLLPGVEHGNFTRPATAAV
ncbi:MAG TPA: radical SAM protein [Candidatus Dormibacteraeota bacterium]|nr:radical SAM protein [Candidatus Dormibacteraeota bacterium]